MSLDHLTAFARSMMANSAATLLEQALDPTERRKLGAHYTPRAYVERLVGVTVMEPLRADWQAVQTKAEDAVEAGKREDAVRFIRAFHHQLCTTRVLDPASTWALATWKTLLEIRALHDQAKATNMPQSILDGIKTQIDETVQRRIEEHVAQVAPATVDEGRQHELNNQLRWTLRQILAKIERGMTVEIRFLPPAVNSDTPDDDEAHAAQTASFDELHEIAKALEFPALQGEPLLALEAPPAESAG